MASHKIHHDLGLSAGDFGLVGSEFFSLFAVGAVGLSAAMSWISAKLAAAILMFTSVASILPLAVPNTFGMLPVSLIVLGFFGGPAHALCQSVVADRFPKENRADQQRTLPPLPILVGSSVPLGTQHGAVNIINSF